MNGLEEAPMKTHVKQFYCTTLVSPARLSREESGFECLKEASVYPGMKIWRKDYQLEKGGKWTVLSGVIGAKLGVPTDRYGL